jgi:hypothetical protein
MVGAPIPGDPRRIDAQPGQDAFVMETAGVVLLSWEIRIRVTPSLKTGVFESRLVNGSGPEL